MAKPSEVIVVNPFIYPLHHSAHLSNLCIWHSILSPNTQQTSEAVHLNSSILDLYIVLICSPTVCDGISESVNRMIHVGYKRRTNHPVSWVERPLPFSFFCSYLLPPSTHQLPGLTWMVSPFALIHYLFILSFLSLFLALLCVNPTVVR